MKKVALLGDSIRMGYAPRVMGLLGENYIVYSPVDNCRYSQHLFRMLFDCRDALAGSDVIHFNCGIWDVVDNFGDGPFTPENVYVENIVRIAEILQRFAPRVIFATTTPTFDRSDIAREDILSYNAKAVSRLKEIGVEINDLFSVVDADIAANVRADDKTHLTEAGNELCARQVADVIRKG